MFTCIFLGFIVGTSVVADEVKLSSRFRSEKMFIVITKWIAPVCIVAILVTSILSAAGLFYNLIAFYTLPVYTKKYIQAEFLCKNAVE